MQVIEEKVYYGLAFFRTPTCDCFGCVFCRLCVVPCFKKQEIRNCGMKIHICIILQCCFKFIKHDPALSKFLLRSKNSLSYSFGIPQNKLYIPVHKVSKLLMMLNNNDKIRITEGHLSNTLVMQNHGELCQIT